MKWLAEHCSPSYWCCSTGCGCPATASANSRACRKRWSARSRTTSRPSERNKQIIAEVADLKAGMAAIEERARSELGMIGRNETFYQVVPVAPAHGAPREPTRAHADRRALIARGKLRAHALLRRHPGRAAVAGGSSSSVPKQYAALGSSTVIEHALAPFEADADCAGIVVAVAADDHVVAGHRRAPYPVSSNPSPGGEQRAHSVRNALRALAGARARR